jgi:hypothetical protein
LSKKGTEDTHYSTSETLVEKMRDVQKFLGKIKDKLLKLIIKLKIEEVS